MTFPIARCAALIALSLAVATGAQAAGQKPTNQVDGVALHGFDPVAYFTQHKAVKGSPEHTARYQGVTYEFASKEDQTTFAAAPAKYVPQFGGFCAYAVTEGIKADVDPHAFAINDGKLYVNYSEEARDAFQADVTGNTNKAVQNWPKVASQSKIVR